MLNTNICFPQSQSRTLGNKSYEVINHLNNVMTVVSDRKTPTPEVLNNTIVFNETDIIAFNDYYPFGMLLDNRNGSGNYRFGFQGQEKDDEIKGNNNSINYKYRVHDPRLGRFFVVDPLAKIYVYNSTYAFSENTVINAIELEGLEKENVNNQCDDCIAGQAEVKNSKHKNGRLSNKESFTDINGRFFQYNKDLNSFIEVSQIPIGKPIGGYMKIQGDRREREAKKLFNNITNFLNATVFVFDYSDKNYKAMYLHETSYGNHIITHRDGLINIWKYPLRRDKNGRLIKNWMYKVYRKDIKKNYKKIINKVKWNIVNRPGHLDFRAKYSFNEWNNMPLGEKVEFYQLYQEIARMTISQYIHIIESQIEMNEMNSQTTKEDLERQLKYYKNEYNLLYNNKK